MSERRRKKRVKGREEKRGMCKEEVRTILAMCKKLSYLEEKGWMLLQ